MVNSRVATRPTHMGVLHRFPADLHVNVVYVEVKLYVTGIGVG